MEKKLNSDKIIEKMKKIKNVNSIHLFGSQVTGKTTKFSDVDICITGKLRDKEKLNIFKEFSKYDVSFFNELPIWIKIRVFRNGEIIYVKDKHQLYNLLFSTIKEYEDFLPLIKRRVIEKFGKWQI